MNWLRLYHSTLDDPKVQRLAPELFKTWINLLCLAGKLGGQLPPVDEIAFALRVSVEDAEADCRRLVNLGLLDKRGQGFTPHNWEGRQKPSDSSTKRVRKHRGKAGNGTGNDTKQTPPARGNGHGTVDVTLHETAPERPGNALDQIRSDQIREEKIINTGARDAADDDDDDVSIYTIFKKLTGRHPTPKDHEAVTYLDGKGIDRDTCERGIALAIERAPGHRVNSLAYCVPVIEEVAAARAKLRVGSPAGMIVVGPPALEWSPGPADVEIIAIDDPDGESRDDVGAGEAEGARTYSESQKAPVFAAAGQFVRQHAAMHGEQPARDALRAHLVEWCIGRGIDIGIVDAIYPAPVEATK